MNRMRFGALLLMRGRRFGFYLSHRVVLTVPRPGVVRAASLADFQPAQVFAADGVAIPFFEAMTTAANSNNHFPGSFEMVKQMLSVPRELRLNDFIRLLGKRYGANLVEFKVLEPQNEGNQQEDNEQEEPDVITVFSNSYDEACAEFANQTQLIASGSANSDKASMSMDIIAKATTAAGAAAIHPIPLSDADVLVPIQVAMIANLAGLYGLDGESLSQSALPFVAKLVGLFAAPSLHKLIPELGNAINSSMAETFTATMGKFVKNNFDDAMAANAKGLPAPQLIFDVELFRQFYAEFKNKEINNQQEKRQ